MVVLDGIGKDIGLAFTVGLGVLLGTDHDGLGAVAFVEEVDGGIEFLHFPDLPGIDIEEILLQGTARRDAIDDDSGALVLQALDEETVEQFRGCLHDGDGAVGGGDEPELLILPVLQQVFAEGIGADEDAHDGCHRVLSAELLGTTAGVVGDMRAQLVLVCDHPAEGTAGADALLLRQLLIGHDVLAVEFLPCAHDVDIVEREAHPVAMVLGKIIEEKAKIKSTQNYSFSHLVI